MENKCSFTYQHLTEEDKKCIRAEMRPMQTLFVFFCLLAAFAAALLSLVFHLVQVAAVSSGLIVIIGYVIFRHGTKDYRLDMLEGEKEVAIRKIDALELNPQDGVYVGEIRNNVTATEHPNFRVGHFVRIGNLRYPIRKELFEQLQGAETCAFHTAPHSRTFLGVFPA